MEESDLVIQTKNLIRSKDMAGLRRLYGVTEMPFRDVLVNERFTVRGDTYTKVKTMELMDGGEFNCIRLTGVVEPHWIGHDVEVEVVQHDA